MPASPRPRRAGRRACETGSMRPALAVPLAAGRGAGARRHRLRRRLRGARLPAAALRPCAVLPPGADPLRVLHSQRHSTCCRAAPQGRRGCAGWPALDPDLVLDTGDNAQPPRRRAGPRRRPRSAARPSRRVRRPGSNDYYAPQPKNPARYLLPDDGRRVRGETLPCADLRAACRPAGWADLTNRAYDAAGRRARVALAGTTTRTSGRDRYDAVAGPRRPGDLRLGAVHAPEPRVLDRFAADGHACWLAGHTHGGQLRVPGLRRAGDQLRPRAPPAAGPVAVAIDGTAWLHVSAGLGTSPYAPVRFACRPEATLLTLAARGWAHGGARIPSRIRGLGQRTPPRPRR